MIKLTKKHIAIYDADGNDILAKEYRKHPNRNDEISFEWAEMYAPPRITMAFLSELSQAFGTTDIDVVGDIHQTGCETCDHGSLYGHTIHIRNITRWPELA